MPILLANNKTCEASFRIRIKKLIFFLTTNNIDGVRIATEVISVHTIDTKANNVKTIRMQIM